MDRITVPAQLLRSAAAAEHYVLRVVGDALAPEFKDGDFLVLLRAATAEAGETVLLTTGDEATIRRLEEDGPCSSIVVGLMRRYDKR